MVSARSKISLARARKLWTSDRSSVSSIGATFLETKYITANAGRCVGFLRGALVRARFRAYPVIAGLVNRGLAILTR
jgi:hypothetical protein